ncbi:MAG: hypothetical protein JXA62_01025 [Candidatus Aminicenantes bacterium]|nr:hypothetical protein [Candidatus Aminicenantes bacterium]
MDSRPVEMILPLDRCAKPSTARVGGKARMLARLMDLGFAVPPGICLTVVAYERFVREHDLEPVLQMELERKRYKDMRWEEMWDSALRLRSRFLNATFPADMQSAITESLLHEHVAAPWVVRSSAPAEDAKGTSFAGLHESVVGVRDYGELWDALRTVWASLWSDAAILYRRELALDSRRSRMAVVIQSLVERSPSGVAFGRDPREPRSNRSVVEAVPGLCKDLVDGEVDPDRWIIENADGRIVERRTGGREDADIGPLLGDESLKYLWRVVRSLEEAFDFPPDTEWTGRDDDLVLLQARPMTTAPQDDKAEYLSLRPGPQRLRSLARRVVEELIPQLEAEGRRWSQENLETITDPRLADALQHRLERLSHWKRVYKRDFIPFAHGVRALGRYYNDLMRPDDPYEFLDLLRGADMLASRRNRDLAGLSRGLAKNADLRRALQEWWDSGRKRPELDSALKNVSGGKAFVNKLEKVLAEHFDVAFGDTRLWEERADVIAVILEMSQLEHAPSHRNVSKEARRLEKRFLAAAGPRRKKEAEDVLRIGRLSWRLRDDDNILVGRLESQLRRALDLVAERLHTQGRIPSGKPVPLSAVPLVMEALRHPGGGELTWLEPVSPEGAGKPFADGANRPRQLTGQPASPGMATGAARVIAVPADLARFRAGEVLICDAIQPNMTHLVPLAAAVVERRGGMLIHGAIIAREMGIPCVNGVPAAAHVIRNGDVVTVDGHLGIVTLGEPEFDLETAAAGIVETIGGGPRKRP